jgi:hypothetical protein
MKKSENIVVDGRTYTVNPYVTSTGMMLWWEILSKFGEGLVSFVFQFKDAAQGKAAIASLMTSDIKPEQISSLLSGLQKMSPEEFQGFVAKVLANTCVGSRSVMDDYDTRFAGEYKHLVKLVWKTLEVQFRDFFSASGAKEGAASQTQG